MLFKVLPTSFLPNEDQGFVTASITLPSGATDERLGVVLNEIKDYFLARPEVLRVNSIAGNNGNQNSGNMFIRLKPWGDRPLKSQSAEVIARQATKTSRTSATPVFLYRCSPPCAGSGPARASTSCSRT